MLASLRDDTNRVRSTMAGGISKRGDRLLRTMLYEAANSLLCRVRPGVGQQLKDWAMALKQRTSHKKAVARSGPQARRHDARNLG